MFSVFYKRKSEEVNISNPITFVIFVGYPRSGHSLVGSLIDAHPHAIISHELDVLGLLKDNQVSNRQKLYSKISDNSRTYAERGRTSWGYSYDVPELFQGKATELKVIGDKKGGDSTMHLAQHPELLDQLKELVGSDLKIIHIIRNPFDIIATRILRGTSSQGKSQDEEIDRITTSHQHMTQVVSGLRDSEKSHWIDMKSEDLKANAKPELQRLFAFLGLSTSEGFLQACSNIIDPKVSKTRKRLDWRTEQISRVNELIRHHEFLNGYSYE